MSQNSVYLIWAIAVTAQLQIGFTSAPSFDVWVSSLFWTADSGFSANSWETARAFRKATNNFFAAFTVFALAAFVAGLMRRPFFNISTRIWGVICLIFLIGPGLLANGLLKTFWGRARPQYITEFGGDLMFTPPFEIADQCASNCSFVSGEASNAAALLVSFLLLARYIKPPLLRAVLAAGTIGITVFASVMRIVLGRHFLSDVLFAWMFVILIALVLVRVFLLEKGSEPDLAANQAKRGA